MEVEITYQNLREISADLEETTHHWATTSCCNLAFLAHNLKERHINRERFGWIKGGIEDLLTGLKEHERGPLAYSSFCGLYDTPVEVFGRFWASYHEAAFNLHFCALQEIQHSLDHANTRGWHGSEPSPELHLVRAFAMDLVTASRIKDIACAFWKTIPINPSDEQAKFDWFLAALHVEYDRVIAANRPGTKVIEQRAVVSTVPPQIAIDGKAYSITDTAAILLQNLVNADGEWVSGSDVVNQPSRVVAAMPEQVRMHVEASPGKGFRFRRRTVI